MPAPPFDQAAAHRWFAVEFNNQAWDLIEAPQRSSDEASRMVDLAHAAALHWREVGKPVNHMRALSLLAQAYAAAGEGAPAIKFARKCAELSAALDDEQSPFDRAAAAASMSCALHSNGQSDEAQTWEKTARTLADQLDDADDKKAIERLLKPALPDTLHG